MTTNTPSQKVFQVTQQVRVRATASLKGNPIRWANVGEKLTVDASSHTEAEGYVWWKHAEGWSAERTTDGKDVYLTEVTSAPVTATPAPATSTPAPAASTPAQPAAQKVFQVSQQVRVRATPSAKGTAIRWANVGEKLTVDASSRTEAENYVWWKHAEGWSAERTLDGTDVYLVDPASVPATTSTSSASAGSVMGTDGLPDVTKLPLINMLFTRPPVPLEQTDWTQYFGNTQYAFDHGVQWGYDKFAQGLHSGVDYGTNNQAGLPVFAGTTGTFMRFDKYGVHVKVGDYHIIYQHMVNVPNFAANAAITPDTQLGMMEQLANNVHLHLEVRYKEKWIINSLLFQTEAFRNAMLAKFKNFPHYFCTANGWTQWQTPLDQPVIVLAGPPIGPTAKK